MVAMVATVAPTGAASVAAAPAGMVALQALGPALAPAGPAQGAVLPLRLRRPDGAGPHCALAAAATAATAALGCSAVRRGLRQRSSRRPTTVRAVSRKQWNERVKRIEGYRAVFDVVIPKPLGVIPKNFTNRPGVGIAQIKEGGNCEALNERVILQGEEGMWVLEGDEVIAVDGIQCEAKSLDFVGPLVKSAPGDTVTLTLCRNYQKGPVKVVWKPGDEMITMTRGSLLRSCAEAANADVRYSCKDGWCSSCWHTEETSDLVHRICKFPVPQDWDNVKPLVLLRADYTFKTKGLLVKNLMQADGYIPPAPIGVDADRVRKQMEEDNVR